jgi:hypothetical protein
MRLYHVMDLKGLGFQHVHQGFLMYVRTISQFGQDNFPEQVEKIFVLNAPWIFQTVLNFVKVGISAKTLEKLTPLDSATADEELSKYFSADLVQKIKELMEMEFDHSQVVQDDNKTQLTVEAYSSKQVTIPLPNSTGPQTVSAEFSINSKDIKIRLHISREEITQEDDIGLDSAELLHSFSLSSGSESVQLEIPEGASMLIVEFDNNHSLFTSKTVHYNIAVSSQN